MALDKWMADYGDRELGKLHMPGSHDAGTAKDHIELTSMGTNSNAATQTLTIVQQLAIGTRFFDLRLKATSRGVVAHHTTAGQGALSTDTVDETLRGIAAWWDRGHKTEVVILRISHTDTDTNIDEIIKRSAAGALHTGTGNLCTKTLSQIVSQGGGLICILDEKKFGKKNKDGTAKAGSVINQAQGIHGYTKYKNAVNGRGIATCGCYDGGHALHDVVCAGLRGQYVHNEKHGDRHGHLWQVYWQKTYKNPLSSTGIEGGATKKAVYRPGDKKVHGGTHAATDYMLKLMKGMGGKGDEEYDVSGSWHKKKVLYSTLPVRTYCLPNIISYDFVNPATNRQIIDMNTPTRQAAVVGG
jgi:hypothetical protein